MKLNNIFFAFTLWLVLGAAEPMSAQAPAPNAGGDILSRDAVLRDSDIPDLGNPQGDITIVEYFDYQ
jgi:protein-disulfide isomerase